ncbi:MAG TPA: hypothetical protein VF044_02600, partial [Actinomycetota bacterium]
GDSFSIDGNDADLDGSPGPLGPVAGIATRSDANTAEAIGSLDASQLDAVRGLGFAPGPPPIPSILTVGTAPSSAQIDAFVDAAIALPGALQSSITTVSGGVSIGTISAPRVTHFTGPQLEITAIGELRGVGLMIVAGDLVVSGNFEYAGLVVVLGDTRILTTPGSPATGTALVRGSLWTRGLELTTLRSDTFRYSSQALGLAEAAGAGGACGLCGDGFVDAGESCDDGDLLEGDCCSPTCTLDPSGTPCADDANVCTDDVCDDAGTCTHPPNTASCEDGNACTIGETCTDGACDGGAPVACGHCLPCDPVTGCPAPPVCRTPDRPERAKLVVSPARDIGQRLRFKWRGGRIVLPDLGDPARKHAYEVCISGDDPPSEIFFGSAGAGFVCGDGEACWRGSRGGFLWKGGADDVGLRRIALRAGAPRKAAVLVSVEGDTDVLPSLPWPAPLTVTVRGTQGICWESEFRAENVTQSGDRLVGRGSAPVPPP